MYLVVLVRCSGQVFKNAAKVEKSDLESGCAKSLLFWRHRGYIRLKTLKMLQNWLKPLTATFSSPSKPCRRIVWVKTCGFPRHAARPEKGGSRADRAGRKRSQRDPRRLVPHCRRFSGGRRGRPGNLRKPDAALLIPVVFELLSGKVLPVLIGGPTELAPAQFLAYQEAKALANLAVVDERPPLAG